MPALTNLKLELNRADIATNVQFLQDSSHDNSLREDEAKLIIKVEDAKIWNSDGRRVIDISLNGQEVKNSNDGSTFDIKNLKTINLILPKNLAEGFYRAIYIREKLSDRITGINIEEDLKWKFTIRGINYQDSGLNINQVENSLTLITGIDFRVANKKTIDFDVIVDFSPDGTAPLQEFKVKEIFHDLEELFVSEEMFSSQEPFILCDLNSPQFAEILKFQKCGLSLPPSPTELETNLNWIYNLELPKIGGGVEKFYQIKLDEVIRNQRELNLWKECGFDNVADILRANANGFTIVSRDGGRNNPTIGICNIYGAKIPGFGDLTDDYTRDFITLIIKGKKYLGYDMIGLNQEDPISEDAKTSNESLYGLEFASSTPALSPTKDEIDGFFLRMLCSGPGIASDQERGEGFLEDFTHDQLKDKRNCLGFQPSDLSATGNYLNGDHGFWREEVSTDNYIDSDNIRTKIEFDIWEAENADKAIDLAFFGIGYTKNLGTIGTPYNFIVSNHDFDEIYESKGDLLKRYQKAIQYIRAVRWTPNYSDEITKNKIDDAFAVVEKWVNIWDKKDDYSNYSESKITELRDDKAILDEFNLNAMGAMFHPWEDKLVRRWGAEINQLISEIETKLNSFNTPQPPSPNQQKVVWEQKLQSAKAADYGGNKKLDYQEQNIFEHADIKNNINDDLFNALEELINLLKTAFEAEVGNIDDVNKNYRETLTKLENYTNPAAGTEEKAAWKIANESVKKLGRDWGKAAIEHLKTVIAKKTAKDKTYGQETLSQDEFDEIFDHLKEEITVKATIELLEKVKEALKKTEVADSLLDELIEYREATGRSEKRWAWEAVNKFEYENNPQGEEAIKKLESLKSKIKILQDKLTNPDNLEDLRLAFEKVKADPEFAENQNFLEKWNKHQEAKLKIRSGTDIPVDQEEVAKILAIKYKDNDYYNKDNKSKLEEVIRLCEKFTGAVVGTSEEEFYQNYKEIIDEKISEVQARLDQIRNEESQKPKDGSTLQTILICSAITVFLGIVAYFFKRREEKEE